MGDIMGRKDNKYNQTETNKYAENFLNKINNCIDC